MHCMAGHGRTGTIVALLLVQLYGVSAERALELTTLFHQQRVVTKSRTSPKTGVQFFQVRRLTAQLHRNGNAAAESWGGDDDLKPPSHSRAPRGCGYIIIFDDDDDD